MDYGVYSLAAIFAGGLSGFFLLGSYLLDKSGVGRSRVPIGCHVAYLTTARFGGLDGIRALSVIAVIWAHVSGVHEVHLLNQGHYGVDLFFAISGFLVTTLLLREYRITGRVSLRNFYIRRSLRIFPIYYAVLAMYCALVFLTLGGGPKAVEFWNNLPAFATYTSNWFVSNSKDGPGTTFYFAWSLATEEQFYLFWPPLLLLILYKTGRHWPAALAALALVGVHALVLYQDGAGALTVVLGSLAPAILSGVAFAVLLDNRQSFTLIQPALASGVVAPALAIAILAAVQLEVDGMVVRFLMAALVASVCVREDTVLHPLLRWRPLALIGSISYGIYLMHMLVANIARKLLGHQFGWDIFLLTSAAVCVIAFLSFRYFESPIMRLKQRFYKIAGGADGSNRPCGDPTR